MTDIVKVVDIMPDEAKHLAQRLHRKKDEIELHRKSLLGDIEVAQDEERSIVARVSTNDRDRDGEIVEPGGIELKDFQANPVLLWAHRYDTPPVGKALWSKTDDSGLVCKFQFAKTQFAEDIYQLYKGGYLRAFSIGFIATDFDAKTKTYNKISLLEVSAVPVPANQNALVMEAYAKGIVTSDALKADLGIASVGVSDEEPDAPAVVDELAQAGEKTEETNGAGVVAEAAGEEPEVVEEPKEATPEAEAVEEKALDLKGNPSVYDILGAIWRLWGQDESLPIAEQPLPVQSVVDLYPVDYPNGHVVLSEWEPNKPYRYYQRKYRYAEGMAEFIGEPIPIEPAYSKRGFEFNRIGATLAAIWEKVEQAVKAAPAPEPAPAVEAPPCKQEPEGSTPSAGSTIRIVEAPKSESEQLREFIRSSDFRDIVRDEIDRAIGRVR